VYAFTDSHRRHNDYKFGETKSLVEFEYCFCVHISFTRACFHFNAKSPVTFAEMGKGVQVFGFGEIVPLLDAVHVYEKVAPLYIQGITNAKFIHDTQLLPIGFAVHDGKCGGLFILSGEKIGYGVYCFRLEVLGFEF
jgi:hypothetical protein